MSPYRGKSVMPAQKSVALRRSCRLTKKYNTMEKVAEIRASHLHGSSSGSPCQSFSKTNPSAGQPDTASNIAGGRQECVPRPPNAFMLFRSDFWASEKLKDKPIERDHRDISRIAAICWNNLNEEIKADYRRKAEEQRESHQLRHPGYKFSPIRREAATRKRRSRKGSVAETERCQRLADQAMAEFKKGGHSRETQKNMVTGEQQNPNAKGECVTLKPTTESGTISLPQPVTLATTPFGGKMECQVAIYDTVDPPFSQKPLIEQYIPEMRFWYRVGSPQDQAPYVDAGVGSQLVLDASSWNEIHLPYRVRVEGEENVDCDAELDKYFQFDRDEET